MCAERDIVACMITVDRTLFGKKNYLGGTLTNLARSGFFQSDRLSSFQIFDSRSPHSPETWLDITIRSIDIGSDKIRAGLNCGNCLACENAGVALESSGRLALNSNAGWVLFLEDDLDFCSDFLDSVGRYLDHCAHEDQLFTDCVSRLYSFDEFRIAAFGCPYPQTGESLNLDVRYWLYPVDAFYGTQCFAIRSHDAISLGRYLQQNPTQRNSNEYDLMIHEWMRATYPEHHYFLASAPSFVEHIGRESICTDKLETHRNPSWPGREWSYK